MEINLQLNQLLAKINAVESIEGLKELRKEFVPICFAFGNLHKTLERGHEFDWYKRFDPVISVLDKELEAANLENAKSSMTSNISAMLSFKKDPNKLMGYQSLKNENKEVDRKEKIEFIRKNSEIQGYSMSGVYLMHNQVAEISRILWGLVPKEENKESYNSSSQAIEGDLTRLLAGSSKWSSAIRPTESTVRDYTRVKKDLYNSIQECIRLLEATDNA